jgi:esterase/lipase superfamily enzyme
VIGKLRASLASLGFILAFAPALSGCNAVGMAETGSSLGASVTDHVAQGASNVGNLFSHRPDAPPYREAIFVVSTREKGHPGLLNPGGKARDSLDFISVPPGHEAGTIERPSFGSADRERHFVFIERRPLDDQAFRAAIAAHLSGRIGVNRDVLIYVHGFNTSLQEARFRLAQIVYDGKFGGVPVLFTWPSKTGLLSYGVDKETAMASRGAYLKMLTEISQAPGVGRIHILAHSMGAWLTMEALRESALSGAPDLHGKLGDVMLAAPDIDLSVFRQQLQGLDASHISVFVSKDDRALQVSAGLQGDRRLGALDPGSTRDRELIQKLGVRVFDISNFSSGLIGHDNYEAPQVVKQIGKEIAEPRASDGGQAVIDAGADRTPRPPPDYISRQPLLPPNAAAASGPKVVTPETPAPATPQGAQ